MHVRFSTCIGLPVVVDHTHETIAFLLQPLIEPDSGVIEGFFVQVPGGFFSTELSFLSCLDIVRWGTTVHVRSVDAVGPLEDFLRAKPIYEEERPLLGNRIRTENGRSVGRCADIQFNTKLFTCEWIFPRRWWLRWGRPIPLNQVIEVRRDAIIIRDEQRHVPEHSALDDVLDKVTEMTEKPVKA